MRVSVVVPTYKRPELLERCLSALAAQELDWSEFEIIVSDDAHSELTRMQVASWAAFVNVAVRYTTPVGRRGPAAARNAGWRAAEGEVVAFTDDDCIPDLQWLSEGVAACARGAAAVSGRVVVPLPDRPTDYERDAAGLEAGEFVTANCFVRREVLEAIGGFDERYAAAWREDSDLQFTLLERGWRIDRSPGAIVFHPVRPAPWGVSLWQQRKSMFNALLYKKFPGRYRRQIRRWPPWDYYAIVGAILAAAAGAAGGWRVLVVAAAILWGALTARFLVRRLRRNSLTPRHVAEMAVTSALIPPLSVFWRLYGALRFRVLFF